ncbi:MAG: hypothetical protein ACLPX5_00645 [Dissulfurispiraceae bacterium]
MKKIHIAFVVTTLVFLLMAGVPNVGFAAGQGQAVCGSANGANFPAGSPPTSGLCSTGRASTLVAGTEGWSWTCTGANGKSTLCQAYASIAPVCGPADGSCTGTAPTTGLCSAGEPSAVTGSATTGWSWTCSSAGLTESCSALSAACTNSSFYYRDTISWTSCALSAGNPATKNSATVVTAVTPVTTTAGEYSCEMSFTITGDPFSSTTAPFCVATPVTGLFASGYTAYATFDVTSGTPNTYSVNVVIPQCTTSACLAPGGVSIICVP